MRRWPSASRPIVWLDPPRGALWKRRRVEAIELSPWQVSVSCGVASEPARFDLAELDVLETAREKGGAPVLLLGTRSRRIKVGQGLGREALSWLRRCIAAAARRVSARASSAPA